MRGVANEAHVMWPGDSTRSPSPSLSPDEDSYQLQLDDIETPSDSESLHVAVHGLDLGVKGQRSHHPQSSFSLSSDP